MLTNIEALDVVVLCVHGVSGEAITPDRTLKAGGIVDAPRLGAFRSLVVTDPQRGVSRDNHRIDPSALSGISIDDTAQATADVVRANAVPAIAGVLLGEIEAAPKRGARKRQAGKTKRAGREKKKAATRKRATGQKTAKKTGKKKTEKCLSSARRAGRRRAQ